MKQLSTLLIPLLFLLPVFAHADEAGLQFIAGNPNTESGIKFVPMEPIDGAAKLVQESGRYCLKTDFNSHNPYIYFNVDRKLLLKYGYQPYEVEVTVEYLDSDKNAFAIQYDAPGSTTEAHYRELAHRKTGTGEWKKAVFHIKDAQFGNGQQGVSDMRICAVPESDVCISAIGIKCLNANKKPTNTIRPEQTPKHRKWVEVPAKSVVIVRPLGMSSPEQIALKKLIDRFVYLGMQKPEVTTRFPAARQLKSGMTVLVVGSLQPKSVTAHTPSANKLIGRLKSSKEEYKVQQGYVIDSSTSKSGAYIVYAAGPRSLGSVYAMAHLQTHLWYDGDTPALHFEKKSFIEAPGFQQRELYINIGYGLSRDRITPDTWTVQDWKNYIDKLVLARYSAWSFYLWGDSELAHPESNINREKNIQVHKTIQEAIKYSHERGLKVGYHLSPTMIPEDILAKHPEMKATLEYPANGIICPSKPLFWELSTKAYGNEIEWFKACDFFPIWFYDCGGCFCDQCKVPDQQLATLVKQVKVFDEIIHSKNLNAVTQVVTWAIWRYERMHKYHIRDRFMQQMADLFKGRMNQAVISDGIYIDDGCEPLFPLAKQHGFASKSFLYQTNIEDGQPFVMPMTRYFENWVPKSVKAGATQIHLMRMECQTKYPQDFVGGYLFWNPSARGNEALELYSNYEIGNSDGGHKVYQAMLDMDDFAWYGYQGNGANTERGARISSLLDSAIDSLPAKRKADLEWLSTTGKGYAILGKAVETRANEDQEGLDAITEEYRDTLMQSPTFKSQVDTQIWLNLFQKWHVGYFYQGYSSGPF